MPVSAIFKYDVPRSKCLHEGEVWVLTFQDIIFEYGMNKCALSVLSYDQLQKFKKK